MRIGRRFFQTTAQPGRASLGLAGRSITLSTETATESEWPDETTTGATTPGSLIAVSGNITLSTAQTYEGRYVTGQIRVTASSGTVTIRNCIIDFRAGSNSHAINTVSSGATVIVEDCEMFCPMDGVNNMSIALYGNRWIARRCYVHHSYADAFRPIADCELHDSYVHSLGDIGPPYGNAAVAQHADAVQILAGTNFTATGNNFEIPNFVEPEDKLPGDFMNSAGFMIQNSPGPTGDILIEGNRINGGDYSIRRTGAVTNMRVRNNVFGRDHLYGPFITTDGFTELCGNTWEDTGALISGNSACAV
jgi:hypothetical protein